MYPDVAVSAFQAEDVSSKEAWWNSMTWGARVYSKGQIDRAGSALIQLAQDDPARQEAIAVVDNWRSSHGYPLQVIKMTLSNRAKKIDGNALIAQRLKRRPSIEIKLRDNPNMKLSQMHDLGGCRAVLSNVNQVKKLVAKYKEFHAKSPKGRSDWDGSDDFDYIAKPKPDGYRSIHLVFRFQSGSDDRRVYNGQRIEIQIRSKIQHLWATAVEMAQLFTGQALKSKVKNASEDWLRFFALTSSAFALREKCPLVPGMPEIHAEIVLQLREILARTDIMRQLSDWNDTVHLLEVKKAPGAHFYMLILDPDKRTLNLKQFRKEEAAQAQQAYDRAEKETENSPNIQVVLVSVDKFDALPKAYPNYYVDTKDFISAVEKEIKKQ